VCSERAPRACAGGGRGEPFVSEHYDGIPAGAVVEFLERHGFSDWKRVGQGWLNLRVQTSFGAMRLKPSGACAGKNLLVSHPG